MSPIGIRPSPFVVRNALIVRVDHGSIIRPHNHNRIESANTHASVSTPTRMQTNEEKSNCIINLEVDDELTTSLFGEEEKMRNCPTRKYNCNIITFIKRIAEDASTHHRRSRLRLHQHSSPHMYIEIIRCHWGNDFLLRFCRRAVRVRACVCVWRRLFEFRTSGSDAKQTYFVYEKKEINNTTATTRKTLEKIGATWSHVENTCANHVLDHYH